MLINFIDDYLIEFWFQPFAHWFQKLTGKDNFSLSYYCCFSFWCVGMLVSLIVPIIAVLATWFALSMANDVSTAKRRYETENSKKETLTQNSHRINGGEKIGRTIVFFLDSYLLMDLVGVFLQRPSFTYIVLAIGLAAHIGTHYFVACTPLPPGTGLFRKWYNSAVEFIKNFGPTSEQPVPVPG